LSEETEMRTAVLVGINEYARPNAVPSLAGCRNDVADIACYLREIGVEVDPRCILQDEAATKWGIMAALTGAATPDAGRLARQAARVGAVLMAVIAAGLLIYSLGRNSFVPFEALCWALAAALAALAAGAVSFRRRGNADQQVALVTAAAAILAWQCLLCTYTAIPPARSARELVSAARPFIGARTALYSVGQYRETVSPYLERTLQLAGYEGELQFGLSEEPARRMTTEQFAERWSAGGDAVAFFDPGVWDAWRRRGLPGRVIAWDNYTVAVSRL